MPRPKRLSEAKSGFRRAESLTTNYEPRTTNSQTDQQVSLSFLLTFSRMQGIILPVKAGNSNFLKRIKNAAQLAFDGANHLLWPALCSVCSVPILETDGGLCKDCWAQLLKCTGGDYCFACGRDVSRYGIVNDRCGNCANDELHFDAIARAGIYDGSLRQMILAFKFQRRTEFAHQLSAMADSAFQSSSFFDETEILVPVPLHWIRRLMRGFNQSHLVCKKINHPSAKINTDLVRIRNTHRQWDLSHAKRKRNVAGAFAVRAGHNFTGKHICLVDDITTSWATLNECAKTLKQAGAKKVCAVVAAVAAQPK